MAEPRTLDPAGATGVPEKNLLLALCEGLTSFDPKSAGSVMPGAAERWEVSADGRTIRFALRECRWSNGDPVTAADFRDSWLRVLEPATASPLANLLFGIEGARDFNAGKAPAGKVGIEAAGARALLVRLIEPQPWFPQICASSPLVPVHGHARDGAAREAGFFVRGERFVGNGPFVLEERIPNYRIVLRKNPEYWDRANVEIERIEAYAGESKQNAVAAFQAGRSDWVDDFPAAQADRWRGRPELRTSPYLATYFLRFNTTKAPFDDRRVREAFHRAIDRAAICERVLRLGQRPATHLVPASIEGACGYRPVEGAPFDPARARALLAEAGHADGRGLGPVQYQVDTNEDNRRIAEAIQAMLRENLGVEVVLVNKEKKALVEDEEGLRYVGMSRGSWIADYVDPLSFLEIFESGAPSNRTGFRCQEYDARLAEARACADPARRRALLADAEGILVTREFPCTPIYEFVKQTLVNPRRIVGGFEENLLGFHPMKWIRMGS
jgi:oligopeptide transport system substrate-binding protein